MCGRYGNGAPCKALPIRAADTRQCHLDDRIARIDLPGRHRFDNKAPLGDAACKRCGLGHDPISRRSSPTALIKINLDMEIPLIICVKQREGLCSILELIGQENQ